MLRGDRARNGAAMSDDLADLRPLADDIFASPGADALLVPEAAPVWNPPPGRRWPMPGPRC